MTDPATAVAAAICWIARQPGIPTMAEELKLQVVRRHPSTCEWCDYEPAALMDIIKDLDQAEADRFQRLPRATQRQLVDRALGAVAA